MRVTVVGAGYVGLVTAACLSETGNDVVCADLDVGKIDMLRSNRMPIYEPGLEQLVRSNQEVGRLRFTSEVGRAIEHGRVVIIAVGTPHEQNGEADLSQVISAATLIARHLNEPKVIVTKSTVPVGTTYRVRDHIAGMTDAPFSVCSNPEFLTQGAAVSDFMKPDRVVVGVESPEARDAMDELYSPFVRTGNPILYMDIASAELTKYAANAMLAARVSFMNQIAELCDRVGADVLQVRRGIAADNRIGSAFLFPGPGYGGSCLPKDLSALVATARSFGMVPDLLEAIAAVNDRQKSLILERTLSALSLDPSQATVAIWGLAFKAGTDDMRDSPAIPLIEGLLKAGVRVRAHDPKAADRARAIFGEDVQLVADPYDAVDQADSLVILAEWLPYRTPDFERIHRLMRTPRILDGRNLYDPRRMKEYGFLYSGIGRR